ncbi:MAG: SDR family NAD(P)-dependent oxidoreductase [Terriglobia bacterium]|jgi:3-oxoacyl-[acyl-carrier protein] reductase
MNITLDNQAVIITGGSRGIGAATVKLFAEAGGKVVFSYLRAASQARELVKTCGGSGRVVAVRANVTKMVDAKRLVDTAIRHFGRLDVLVANAGIWNYAPLPVEKMTEREWDEMMAVNLKGVYSVIHHALPQMIRQQGGRIIVVSSTAGQRGEAFHTHYGASKGGVISLVKGLSTELASHHILVNCVAPGWIETDMARPVLKNRRYRRQAISTIPLGRFGRPEEVAMPILFLASSLSTYMTGEVININGGNVLCG